MEPTDYHTKISDHFLRAAVHLVLADKCIHEELGNRAFNMDLLINRVNDLVIMFRNAEDWQALDFHNPYSGAIKPHKLPSKIGRPRDPAKPTQLSMAEKGRLGGASKSARKVSASRANGKRGGRPRITQKEWRYGTWLLSALQKKNPTALRGTARYDYPIGALRALFILMQKNKLTGEQLGLPFTWNPNAKWLDPYFHRVTRLRFKETKTTPAMDPLPEELTEDYFELPWHGPTLDTSKIDQETASVFEKWRAYQRKKVREKNREARRRTTTAR